MDYSSHFNPNVTPQSEQADPTQVENSGGGFSFQVDSFARLRRFLILGSEGGSYYASESELTRDNARAVLDCLGKDAPAVVREIVEISQSGRAAKNEPAIFALALAATYPNSGAMGAIPKVCRIGTHLFHFAAYVDAFRGWGGPLRRGIASWYTDMPLGKLALQVVKYRQRDGWGHRDLLRKSHPKATSDARNAIFNYVTQGYTDENSPHLSTMICAVEAIGRLGIADVGAAVNLISDNRLPREVVPTHFLNCPDVWDALLPHMGVTALVRNLGKMTSVGCITPFSPGEALVADLLSDSDALTRSRIHPIQVLSALRTYGSGKGIRGNLTWDPSQLVLGALDDAFYAAFKNVRPCGKRIMLALDVSGSMASHEIAGVAGLTPRVASAALALVNAKVDHALITHFTGRGHGGMYYPTDTPTMEQTPIRPGMTLDSAMEVIQGLNCGPTDCAAPMVWAQQNDVEVDAFVVYTDNETNCGRIHPHEALKQYRRATGIDAKLIVVSMVANDFTIADPNDPGMLDVIGFDSAAPALITDFIRGDM